jgi:hypothetical protein
MKLAFTRPEARSRSGREGSEWPDTVPMHSRSEAFAEDLPPVVFEHEMRGSGRARDLLTPTRSGVAGHSPAP